MLSAHLREHFQMSERRACGVLAASRKVIRYTSRRQPETELREGLRYLANERRRFG
jgi:putative transposase